MTLKIFRYIFLGIIGLIIFSLALTQIKSVKLGAFSFFSGIIEENTGYTITVEDIDLMLPFVIKTEGLRIQKNNTDLLHVNRSVFRLNPTSLLERKVIFHSITLSEVLVNEALIDKKGGSTKEFQIDFTEIPFFISIPKLHAYNVKAQSIEYPSFAAEDWNLEAHIKLDPDAKSIIGGVRILDLKDCERFISVEAVAKEEEDFLNLEARWIQNKSLFGVVPENILLDIGIILKGQTESWENFINGQTANANENIVGSVNSKVSLLNSSLSPLKGAAKGKVVLSAANGLQITGIKGSIDSASLTGDIFIDRDFKLNGSKLAIEIEEFEKYKSFHSLEAKGKVNATFSTTGTVESPVLYLSAQSPLFTLDKLTFNELYLEACGISSDEGIRGKANLSFAENHDRLELKFAYTWDCDQNIQIDKFQIDHSKMKVQGSFLYDLSDDTVEGNLLGQIEEISIFEDIFSKDLSGSIFFNATFSENAGQNIDLTLSSAGLKFDEYALKSFEGTINVQDIYRYPQGSIDIKVASLQKGDYILDSIALSSQITAQSKTWPFVLNIKNKQIDLFSEGTWYLKNNVFALDIETLEGTKADYYFSLTDPISIAIEETCARISPFILRVAEGTIHASLNFEEDKLLADLQIVDLPLSFLSTEIYSQPIEGLITSTAQLRGTSDQLLGDLQVDLNGVTLKEDAETQARAMNGSLQIKLQEEGTTLQGMIFGPDSTPVLLDANLPVTAKFKAPFIVVDERAPLSILLKASGALTPLLEFIAAEDIIISGDGDIEVDISGTFNAPLVAGKANITDGTLESFLFGTRLVGIKAFFTGDEHQIRMNSLSANDEKGGSINGTGLIRLNVDEGFPADIKLNIEELHLIQLDNVKGIFDGNINLMGNKDKLLVKGELTSQKLKFAIPKKIDEISETLDVIYINQPSDEPPPTIIPKDKLTAIPMELDIDIHIPNNLNVTQDGLNTLWTGDVNIAGTTEKILAKGELSLLKGNYNLNGQHFELKPGTVTFAGNPEKKTSIYIVASRDINDYRVDIVLQGNLSNPNIVLRSNPPLPQQEVLSLILFGKSPTEISAFQDQQLEQSLSNLTKDQSGPGFINKLQKSVGIDRIDINRQEEEVSIEVGKYITRDVYISVNKGFGDEPTRVAIEAKLKNNFKVQLDAGESTRGSSDRAAGQISLIWKNDY